MRLLILLFLLGCNLKPLHNSSLFNDDNVRIKVVFNSKNISSLNKITYRNIKEIVNIAYPADNYNYILELSNLSDSYNITVMNRNGEASEYIYSLNLNAKFYESDCDEKDNCKAIFNKSFSDRVNYNINSGYYSGEIAKESYRKELSAFITESILDEIVISLSD